MNKYPSNCFNSFKMVGRERLERSTIGLKVLCSPIVGRSYQHFILISSAYIISRCFQ